MKQQILAVMTAVETVKNAASDLGITLSLGQQATLADIIVSDKPLAPEVAVCTALELAVELIEEEKKNTSLAISFIKKQGLLEAFSLYKAKKEGTTLPVAAEPKVRKARTPKAQEPSDNGGAPGADNTNEKGTGKEGPSDPNEDLGDLLGSEAEAAKKVVIAIEGEVQAPLNNDVKTAADASSSEPNEMETLLRSKAPEATDATQATSADEPPVTETLEEQEKPAESAAEPQALAAKVEITEDISNERLAAEFLRKADPGASIFVSAIISASKASAENMAALYPGNKVFPVEQQVFSVKKTEEGLVQAPATTETEKAYIIAPSFPQDAYAVCDERFVKLAAA